MQAYPLFLDLRGRLILVFGAGRVGRRKVASLVPCEPAEILVVDTCEKAGHALPAAAPVRFVCRQLCEADLEGRSLVFAASGDREANARLATLCRARGIFCNIADAPEAGDFLVPAHFASGPLLAAFSTSGLSPAVARRMKEAAREMLEREFGALTRFMGVLRPYVLALDLGSDVHAEIFRAVADSDLGELLKKGSGGDEQAAFQARELLCSLLPATLHDRIGEMVHDFF